MLKNLYRGAPFCLQVVDSIDVNFFKSTVSIVSIVIYDYFVFILIQKTIGSSKVKYTVDTMAFAAHNKKRPEGRLLGKFMTVLCR